MADLMATGQNPGATYTPTTGPYHEDRWANVSGGPGWQMFRVHNATYDNLSAEWHLHGTGSPAYATAQNPDGSIHYFTNPSGGGPWTTWAGSGNNAKYNPVDYGLVAGTGQTQAQRAANVAAIQSAINAAIANIGSTSSGGGTVVIPAGTYELGGTSSLTATISISNVAGGLTIRGESAGTTLIQYGTPPSGGGANTAADMFDLTNAGNPGQLGIRFRELTFQYATGLTVPTAGAIAINCISGVADTSAEACGFYNCPQAFYAGSTPQSGLHCGLINCTITQDGNGYSNSTQVTLSGPEAFILYSEVYQKPMINGGPTGCTGVAVQSGADGCRIDGCHISDFYTGVAVANSKFTSIINTKINAAAALTIVPLSDTGNIYGVYATACTFGMLSSYTPVTPTSGVLIDTNGGPNSNVEGIFLTNCLAYGYENAGLLINAGKSISVTGGKYSSNGSNPGTPISGAGIAIVGSCAQVRIVGADCSGVFDFVGTTHQPYGISVANGVTSIAIAACDLTNNATAALYVSASGTDVRVTDCIGYNDQATVLQSGTSFPSTIKNSVSWTNAANGWYGPIAFYVKGAGQVTIDGTNTFLNDGGYTLGPGESASIAGTATHFLAVGK